MHIFKGRVKGKERKECDGGHLDLNCSISRCWIRGRGTVYVLIQYTWFKQEYKLQIPALKYSPQLLDICVECIIYKYTIIVLKIKITLPYQNVRSM